MFSFLPSLFVLLVCTRLMTFVFVFLFVCFVQAYSLHVIHYYHDNNYLIPINLLRLLAGLIIVFRKQCNM